MEKQKKYSFLLVVILVLASFLRFWRLGSYPALNADEAAIGYNAFSLLETGKDEHGNYWPLHFQSFNDYKPGLYFYLVLPFVKLFGLNVWSVRIPGALIGVASVYLIFLLVNELFAEQEKARLAGRKLRFSLIAALFLSISPWHIHFSRGGWEVNVATFFMLAGAILFLKGLRKPAFFYLSSLAFALSLYTYHAARVVSPVLVLGLIAIYRRRVKFRYLYFAGILAAVALLPLVRDVYRLDVFSRASGVGIFADPGPVNRVNEQRGEHIVFDSLNAKLLHNRLVNYGLSFLDNWASHYHGLFLFLSGDDIERNKVPETGQMYISDIIWVVIGLWGLIRGGSSFGLFVLFWLVIAPLASSLTFQSPNALRSQNMVIPLVIVSAWGLDNSIEWGKRLFRKKHLLAIYFLVLATVILWGFARYTHMYWSHMSKEYPYSSQYGVNELVSFVQKNQGKYRNIVVTTRYDQPYILFLFYMKYPPLVFQADHNITAKDAFGFSTVDKFGKYVFKEIDWDNDRSAFPNSLIIGTPKEIPKEANIIARIYGSNNFEYFDVVAN
jgi:4-amino-4-deoxy-L-arabinose transferase-like glycosyltransferase